MTLRIKGNSLRIRLTKTEVGTLAATGYVEEHTLFAGNKLVYALLAVDSGKELSATFENNKISMFVPFELIKEWPQNSVVGFNANMQVSRDDELYLLLEKDFACLDERTEDQTDHYENPNKTC
jgi:hypothetical protein